MSWIEDFDLQFRISLNKQLARFWELTSPLNRYNMEDDKQLEERLTLEDKMISWYKENKPVTFQDLMGKFNIKELTAKVFLGRIASGHIKLEEENK